MFCSELTLRINTLLTVLIFVLCFVVNSTYSVGGTKYDPELLRNDVYLAKDRVTRLKQELQHVQDEMHNKERGVQTLAG